MHESENAALSKAWAFTLIALFLLAGVIGHDPWKQDETYSFGIIYNFYLSHNWLVPMNAGDPFMEKPPLYYWSAVVMCRLFSPWLALHNAARLTSVLYMLVTLGFTWKLSQLLFRTRPDRQTLGVITISLLLGSFGMMRHAHDMFTDVALITGSTIAFYGMALMLCMPKCWRRAGLWLGLGMGIAFLSKGLVVPGILGVAGVVVYLVQPETRTRRTARTIGVAAVVASPFLLLWPLMLYYRSPELFSEWFWANNFGRFTGATVARLGAGNPHGYFLHAPFWFAFPIFPLACVAAARFHPRWRRPEYLLPAAISAGGLFILLMSGSARALYLLPFFPAFALLAAQGLNCIPERFHVVWNNGARICFSMSIAGLWLLWASLRWPAFLPGYAALLKQNLPLDYQPGYSQWLAAVCAVAFSLLWIVPLRLDARKPASTAIVWFAGIAVLWGIVHTLLLPWIDVTKSYRQPLEKMNAYLRSSPYAGECIGNYGLGESIAPMLQYFGDRHTPPPSEGRNGGPCPLMLTDSNKDWPEEIDPRWTLIWKGERLLDSKNMELRLYAPKK